MKREVSNSMSKENLNKIINNYIKDIPKIYNEEHDELFKWRAVKHFQDNWNIDADDFAKMLKEAMSETSIFINNATVQPLNGLLKLAEIDPISVKEMFETLYECNSKPVNERNIVIDECLRNINSKIKENFGDSWKYKQEKRTIIFYMTILNPDDNYFYKSTEAMNMARCIEYADLSTGSNFRLESYYKMCEQIKEFIKENSELIKVHKSYLTDECWEDNNLNLLVFNIIYSAHAYGYYMKNDIVLKKKSYSTKDQKIKDAIEDKKAKEIELVSYRKELADVIDYLDNLDEIFEIGLEINHVKFGHGNVIGQTDELVEVKFDNGETKKLGILKLFDIKNPLATTEDKNVIEECKELAKKQEEKKELERKIRVLEFQISELDKLINIK